MRIPTTKVLHFLPLFDTGGTEKLVLDIHNGLDRDRFESHICTFFPGEYDRMVHGISSSRHILVEEKNKVPKNTISKALNLCKRLSRLNSVIRRQTIDVLHTHHLGPLLHAFALKMTTCRHIQWIHTEHNVPDLRSGYALPAYKWTNPLRGPDWITGVSTNVCRHLLEECKIPPEKIQCIPNGVEIDRFSTGANREVVRQDLNLNPGDEVVGCIGNLRMEKNQGLAIQACAQLFHHRPHLKLIICGDGSFRSRLEGLGRELGVAERIRFLGYRFDIPRVLSALDIFCLPSHYEGMPLSLLEAWAARKPVVATKVIGIRDLVKDGVDGLLVAPGDPADMSKAIQSLLDNHPLRERLAQNGYGRLAEGFSLQAMVGRYATLYEWMARK